MVSQNLQSKIWRQDTQGGLEAFNEMMIETQKQNYVKQRRLWKFIKPEKTTSIDLKDLETVIEGATPPETWASEKVQKPLYKSPRRRPITNALKLRRDKQPYLASSGSSNLKLKKKVVMSRSQILATSN